MEETYPAKLSVPISDNLVFDFSMNDTSTVANFEQRVLNSCARDELRDFEVIMPA